MRALMPLKQVLDRDYVHVVCGFFFYWSANSPCLALCQINAGALAQVHAWRARAVGCEVLVISVCAGDLGFSRAFERRAGGINECQLSAHGSNEFARQQRARRPHATTSELGIKHVRR